MENSTPVPVVSHAPNPTEKQSELEHVATFISSRRRIRKVSAKLMENQSISGSRPKHSLEFIGTVATYTLNVPHFVCVEYKRRSFERNISFPC